MNYQSDYLRLSTPLSNSTRESKVNLDSLDKQYVCSKLYGILMTLEAESDNVIKKFQIEKNLLKQKIEFQEEKLIELQSKKDKLQNENRQLKFNLNQKCSVVVYLKKKINTIQSKYEFEKEKMASIIKYLESRNHQLNQMIFELKSKEINLNQKILNLQQRYFNLNHEYYINKLDKNQNLNIFKNHSQSSKQIINVKESGEVTPKYPKKFQKVHKLSFGKNSRIDYSSVQYLQDSSIQLEESSVREKTIRNQSIITRAKSNQQLGYYRSNSSFIGHRNSDSIITGVGKTSKKKILINNNEYLTFGINNSGISKNIQHNSQIHFFDL